MPAALFLGLVFLLHLAGRGRVQPVAVDFIPADEPVWSVAP